MKNKKPYQRAAQLKKLILATDAEISDSAEVIAMLETAIAGMIKHSSHWTYDINRHIALNEALGEEWNRVSLKIAA
jgi:hypothetical protein